MTTSVLSLTSQVDDFGAASSPPGQLVFSVVPIVKDQFYLQMPTIGNEVDFISE